MASCASNSIIATTATTVAKMVKLKLDDGEVFDIPVHIAKMSNFLCNMMVDCSDMMSEADDGIPLHDITSKMMKMVISYLEYHHANPTVKKDDDAADDDDEDDDEKRRLDDIIPWDQKFCEIDNATLRELAMAANYLDIKSLLHLACKSIAIRLKGKTVDEMREILGEPDDLTPEEKERIKEETKWMIE